MDHKKEIGKNITHIRFRFKKKDPCNPCAIINECVDMFASSHPGRSVKTTVDLSARMELDN